jgi:VWFA-related protein
MRGPWSALPVVLAGIALSASFVFAAASDAPDFGERIDVRAVDVFAAVTDRSGKRVEGLAAADFRLWVDGREVPIDAFTAVEDGRPVDGVAGSPADTAEPVTAATAVSRNFLVFVDNGFSVAAERDRVLQTLAGQLSLLGPDDRMAIVAFDGDHLAVLADWTANRATLAAALVRAKGQPAAGVRGVAARRSAAADEELALEYDPIFGARAAFGRLDRLTLESPEPQNPGEVSALVRGMPRVVAAADAALRTHVPPPGRRIVLLLSGGWPFRRAPALFWPLTATANQLGYTFYPVDVPGLDPQSATATATTAGTADPRQERPATLTGFITTYGERDARYGPELLARATGGQSIVHAARLSALSLAADDTRSYYRLGFSPVWKADDREHAIRVEVRRPDLDVRARTSYTDLSVTAENALERQSQEIAGPARDAGPARRGSKERDETGGDARSALAAEPTSLER